MGALTRRYEGACGVAFALEIFEARWALLMVWELSLRISSVSLLLLFQTRLDRGRATSIEAEISFKFGEDLHRGRFDANGLAIVQGQPERAEGGVSYAVGAAVHSGVPIKKLEDARTLAVIGDRKLASRFTRLLLLPPKLPA